MNHQERAAQGGRARARNLTPEERSACARKAARARWAKRRAGAWDATVTCTNPAIQVFSVTLVRH